MCRHCSTGNVLVAIIMHDNGHWCIIQVMTLRIQPFPIISPANQLHNHRFGWLNQWSAMKTIPQKTTFAYADIHKCLWGITWGGGGGVGSWLDALELGAWGCWFDTVSSDPLELAFDPIESWSPWRCSYVSRRFLTCWNCRMTSCRRHSDTVTQWQRSDK